MNARRSVPPHIEPDPYSCSCVACDDWRASSVIPGSMVIGIKLNPAKIKGAGSPTWSPNGPFIWGPPVLERALVLGNMPKDSPGGHLDTVMLWNERLGFCVTSKRWLIVLSSPE